MKRVRIVVGKGYLAKRQKILWRPAGKLPGIHVSHTITLKIPQFDCCTTKPYNVMLVVMTEDNEGFF